MAQTITGGDPDAVSHPAQATAPQRQSDPAQNTSPRHQNSNSNGANHSNGLISKVEQACAESHLPHWLTTALVAPLALIIAIPGFIMKLIGIAVSKVLFALNDVLSSTEIPPWALKVMSGLAQGPMRGKLLQLYAEGGDHSRRLSSVVANGKFSSVTAGPDEPWEVSLDDMVNGLC